jgi:hypothetical protein
MKTGNSLLIFIVKSLGFSIIFCTTWLIIFNPTFGMQKHLFNTTEERERIQSETYNQQLQEAERQLAVVSNQQKRMESLLLKYEQQAVRYDAILEKWEKQPRP